MNARRGSVIIITMVVVFAIAAMVLALGKQVRTQALASNNDVAVAKADGAEHGAEQFVLSLLTDYRDTLNDLSETDFSAVKVGDAYFWITRPDYNDSTFNTWGIVDESSKLSLNVATQEQLLGLPGMTDAVAGGIVDWRDADDTVSTNGAETSTYSQAGYNAKNADFESVDELMLVNGMTHELLYGAPPTQSSTDANAVSTSGGDWYLTHGIFDYVTAWSTQPNVAADGTARVSLSDATRREDLRQLMRDKLGNSRGNEIVAALGNQARTFTNIWDFVLATSIRSDELALIEDYVTPSADATYSHQVNINTAPREVLVALGVLSEQDVDTLLAQRAAAVAANPYSMAWVYDVLKAKSTNLGNLVCARGRQYSADIVAASANGRGFRHVRIVVDTTSQPRIVYRRDITDKGWPMDPQILANLKSGTGLDGKQAAGTGAH